MNFSAPEYFLLIPALALVAWFWRGLRLHSPLRAIMLLLLVLSLTGPTIRRQKNLVDLHILLDRSDSTEDLIDRNLPEWRSLLESSKPGRDDTLRFVNYAAEVAELGADGSSFTGSRKLTRTGLALSTIAAEADADRPARVLVFTDGFSTEPLQEAANQLEARGIPVDFRMVRDETRRDFRISRLAFPERVQVGEPFLMTVLLRGSEDGSVPLVIRRNGRVLTETEVTVRGGVASVEFTDRIPAPGGYEYQAEILPENDSHPGNNRTNRWIEVSGGPRILLVTRYRDDPLAKALSSQDFAVATVEQPSTLHAGMLTGARAVILNNVPAHEVPRDFLDALDFFVREQGGGLMMAGGDRSFGSGGYFQSAIDPLLPVSMELKSEHRKLAVALAIVMDRSGSMAVSVAGGKTKMDLANAGAANAVDLLGPMDQVTVFAVDSEPVKVVPLTPIGNRREDITRRIRKVQSAGGGIFVYTGLKAAWEELRKSKAGTRHVILFSDAQDSEEPGRYEELIKEMGDGGCTVSVIGLGTDHDVDAAFLKDIAARGNGRVFFSDRPMDIPTIFAQETVTIARSAFLRDPVAAKPTGRWAEISPKPIDWPVELDAYNLSYAREDATVSLVSSDEYSAPLVAHARRGLGRSAAVSFPLGGEFSGRARSWDGYGDFLQTTGRFLLGDETPPGIALRHRLEGTRLTLDLLYDPEQWSERLAAHPPKVRLADGGAVSEPAWRRIAPGRFSLARDLEEGSIVRGAVQLGPHALPFGPLTVGSSIEWAFDSERVAELRSVSRQTGGKELLDLSKAWLRPPHVVETPLTLPLSVALLVLLPLDALLTRTGWKLPRGNRGKAAPRPKRNIRVKAPKVPKAVQPPVLEADSQEAPETPVATQQTEQGSRFQRAKSRK